MHIPFTPNHILLVGACYPSSAALLTPGFDYHPNAQELSRLAYYAANNPGKINKLGSELEKRAKTDCRKAQAGNARARASLLVTLAVFKTLATECRRDISLLSSALLTSVKSTLVSLTADLEVMARAATVFTAWTTYTDGHLIGADGNATQDYMACLQVFSNLSRSDMVSPSGDHELRNRTRLIGLAALTSAAASEALYHSLTHYKSQVNVIIPALITPLFEVEVTTLCHESEDVKEPPSSPIMGEFRTKPSLERRATSIHLHVDGDKGPSSRDVAKAALRALISLFGRSNGPQAAAIVAAAIACFKDTDSWSKVEHCCWFAEASAEWTQYQYRYAVPTRLVECLVDMHDSPQSSSCHTTLAAMVTAVFTSPTPLINLSTSDIISSLITLILRRISIDVDDILLPALVNCISSLGAHVHYADQIQDLAGELIGRLVIVETNGILGMGNNSNTCRVQAIRCLLAALLGLIRTADMHEAAKEDGFQEARSVHSPSTTGGTSTASSGGDMHSRASRRTRVPPEVWQDTLTLLCDREYAVRSDYAAALMMYLKQEVPKLGDHTDSNGIKRPRPLAEGPVHQVTTMAAMMYGDAITRFLNALHSYVYVLATSSTLGLSGNSLSSSPERYGADEPTISKTNGEDGSSVIQDGNGSRDSTIRPHGRSQPRTRKPSVMVRVLQKVPTRLSSAASVSAVLSDYGNILGVLSSVHENLPIRGILTGVPMLLALDAATHVEDIVDDVTLQRLSVINELIARTWLTIGTVWSCSDVVDIAEKFLSAVPQPSGLTPCQTSSPGVLRPIQQPTYFMNISTTTQRLLPLDTESLSQVLASSENVQEATGLDRQALLHRFNAHWTAESAYRTSLEIQTNDASRGDGLSPLLKVAPALMHIENVSLQSLTRSTREVGVTDLRDVLEGRKSMSNPSLAHRAPSISTLDHASNVAYGELKLTPTKSRTQRSRLGGPGEVRDVLNKLGIGKPTGSSVLKSSFPASLKPDQKSNAFVPPYKT